MKKYNSKLWLLAAMISACLAAYLLFQGYILFSWHDHRYALCAFSSGILFLLGYCVCMYRFFRKRPQWNHESPSETWEKFRKWNTLQIFLTGCVGIGLSVYLCRYTGKTGIMIAGVYGLIMAAAAVVVDIFIRSRSFSAAQRQYLDVLQKTDSVVNERGFSNSDSTDRSYVFELISGVARRWRDTFCAMAFTVVLVPMSIILFWTNKPISLLVFILLLVLLLIIRIVGILKNVKAYSQWRDMLHSGQASEVFQTLVQYFRSCSKKWQFPDIGVRIYAVFALSDMEYYEEALALLRCLKPVPRSLSAYVLYNEALLLEHLNRKEELIDVLGELSVAIPKSAKGIRQRAEHYYRILTNMVNRNYEPVLALKSQQAPNELTRHIWNKLIRDAEEQVFGSSTNINNQQ